MYRNPLCLPFVTVFYKPKQANQNSNSKSDFSLYQSILGLPDKTQDYQLNLNCNKKEFFGVSISQILHATYLY